MSCVKKVNIKHLLTSLAISLGTGFFSGLLTMGAMKNYEKAVKPPLTPSGIVFPFVWTALFILMGISAYLIYQSDNSNKLKSLAIYAVQLVANFVWPLLFFNLQAYFAAFLLIVFLWIAIIIMIGEFFKINKAAAILQIQYLLWVTFAAYLNFAIFLLN